MTQAGRGIIPWCVVQEGNGLWEAGPFTTKSEAIYSASIQGYPCEVKQETYLSSAAPFHVSLSDEIDTSKEKRSGDDYDMAAPLDKLIETLFEVGFQNGAIIDRIYDLLQSLHGSTVANEFYSRVEFDWSDSQYKLKASTQFKVVAFTRHEFYVNADSKDEAEIVAERKLEDIPMFEARPESTVFLVRETT